VQMSIGDAVALRDALTELTDKQRTAIHLYSQGYTQEEIAARDGVSQQAVSCRICGAVRRIKELVGAGYL
jgi:RNA polymerase sigma factor (sigma-70 family)